MAHKERKERLWFAGKVKRPEQKAIAVQRDYAAEIKQLSTCSTFAAEWSSEYVPYLFEVQFSPPPEIRKTMRQIALDVLQDYPGVTFDMLKSARRHAQVSEPRQMVMYQIRKQQPWRSFPEIGRLLNRDHTVAIWSYNKWAAKLDGDEECARKYDRQRNTANSYHSRKRREKRMEAEARRAGE